MILPFSVSVSLLTTCGNLESTYQNASCCSAVKSTPIDVEFDEENPPAYDCSGGGYFTYDKINHQVVSTNFTHTVWLESPRQPMTNTTLDDLLFEGKNGVLTNVDTFETSLIKIEDANSSRLRLSLVDPSVTISNGYFTFTLDPGDLFCNCSSGLFQNRKGNKKECTCTNVLLAQSYGLGGRISENTYAPMVCVNGKQISSAVPRTRQYIISKFWSGIGLAKGYLSNKDCTLGLENKKNLCPVIFGTFKYTSMCGAFPWGYRHTENEYLNPDNPKCGLIPNAYYAGNGIAYDINSGNELVYNLNTVGCQEIFI